MLFFENKATSAIRVLLTTNQKFLQTVEVGDDNKLFSEKALVYLAHAKQQSAFPREMAGECLFCLIIKQRHRVFAPKTC